MIAVSIIGLAGILMVKLVPASSHLTRLAGLWLVMTVAPVFPLLLSLASSNVTGFTAKSTAMAMIVVAYAGGNWVGPQVFLASEAPTYGVSHSLTTYRANLDVLQLTSGTHLADRVYGNNYLQRFSNRIACCFAPVSDESQQKTRPKTRLSPRPRSNSFCRCVEPHKP
jgi:hypothetical protein